jgi:hypothetical protein
MNQYTKSAVCFGVGSLAPQVKPRSGGRSQNRLHAQKAGQSAMKLSNSMQTISAKTDTRVAGVKLASASGRSQNRLHAQKALMEYLLLGTIRNLGIPIAMFI